jgi:hypothetical protein
MQMPRVGKSRRGHHAVRVFCRLLASRHGVAVVVADTAGKWPMMLDPDGDFV